MPASISVIHSCSLECVCAVMYKIYIILYVIVFVGVRCSPYLESDDVLKPKFERNKVNKGVWLRNNSPGPMDKSSLGFIFRANSLDVESQVQNGFDSFSSKQEGLSSGFVGRYKREPHSAINRRLRKNVINNRIKQINSTPSYLNEYYPYEVTVVRENSNNKNMDYNFYPKSSTKAVFVEHNDTEEVTESKLEVTKDVNKEVKPKDLTFEYLRDLVNMTSGNESNVPKRSMKYESENERINLLEAVNTNSNAITNNNEKEEKRWQIAPVTDVVYEIVPKETNNMYNYKETNDVKRGKPVSERGLIKVLSMLTKTFKKIMKQHNDIKSIHSQMHTLNEGCKMNIDKHAKRLEEFDSKYAFFLKVIEKIKTLQDKLKSREEGYKRKEEEMSKYLLKLEGQQKTFLLQQQQFFNIQKSMLAQNEKINQKQNAIAKAQNDISLRQSNFARILEKAKKLYIASKHPQSTTSVEPKTVINNATKENKINEIQSTTTEPIKINLFSIPAANPILNQDEMILRELYDKPIDDLIYKYYFNNTFIDTIIKNKILPGFIIADKTAIARNAKHKRNQHTSSNTDNTKNASRSSTDRNSTKLETTILLPVYNDSNSNSTHRERRWINHHSKKRHRKHHGKGHSVQMQHPLILNDINNTKKTKTTVKPVAVKTNTITDDPFMKMATHFCNEIGQNSTKQILDWCVEKALRRLRSLDTKLIPSPPESANVVKETTQLSVTESSYMPPQRETSNMKLIVTKAPVVSKPTTPASTPTKEVPKAATVSELTAFFPDNDELETNLKQFDLTRDTIGNVYYDGSLHESDIVRDKTNSDLLPDFDSNSRMDLDTRMIMEMPSIKRIHNQRLQNLKKTQRMGRRL